MLRRPTSRHFTVFWKLLINHADQEDTAAKEEEGNEVENLDKGRRRTTTRGEKEGKEGGVGEFSGGGVGSGRESERVGGGGHARHLQVVCMLTPS